MKSLDDIIKERSKIKKRNVCYMDDKGEVVPKEKATKLIITEYDENNCIVNEIIGNIEDVTKDDEEER